MNDDNPRDPGRDPVSRLSATIESMGPEVPFGDIRSGIKFAGRRFISSLSTFYSQALNWADMEIAAEDASVSRWKRLAKIYERQENDYWQQYYEDLALLDQKRVDRKKLFRRNLVAIVKSIKKDPSKDTQAAKDEVWLAVEAISSIASESVFVLKMRGF